MEDEDFKCLWGVWTWSLCGVYVEGQRRDRDGLLPCGKGGSILADIKGKEPLRDAKNA